MLNGKFKGAVKIYRVSDVKTIDMCPAKKSNVVINPCISKIRSGVRGFRCTPGSIKIILCPRTMQRWLGITVYEYHIVPFAIPEWSRRMDVVIHAYKMSLSFNISN